MSSLTKLFYFLIISIFNFVFIFIFLTTLVDNVKVFRLGEDKKVHK